MSLSECAIEMGLSAARVGQMIEDAFRAARRDNPEICRILPVTPKDIERSVRVKRLFYVNGDADGYAVDRAVLFSAPTLWERIGFQGLRSPISHVWSNPPWYEFAF